jgi:hypothetical protein
VVDIGPVNLVNVARFHTFTSAWESLQLSLQPL